MATRSGSPNRTPISTARPKRGVRRRGSASKHWIAAGTSSHPRSTQSWSRLLEHAPGPREPAAAAGPSRPSPAAACPAAGRTGRRRPDPPDGRTRGGRGPRRRCSPRPGRPGTRPPPAAPDPRSSSGASASAADNWAYASPHACRPKKSRPRSNPSATAIVSLSTSTPDRRHAHFEPSSHGTTPSRHPKGAPTIPGRRVLESRVSDLLTRRARAPRGAVRGDSRRSCRSLMGRQWAARGGRGQPDNPSPITRRSSTSPRPRCALTRTLVAASAFVVGGLSRERNWVPSRVAEPLPGG